TSSRTMALAGTRARVGDWTGGDEPVRAQPGGLVTAGEVHPQLGSALLSVAAQLRLGLLRDRADRGLDVQARLHPVRGHTVRSWAPAGGSADHRWDGDRQDGASPEARVRADDRGQVRDLVRVVRQRRRTVLGLVL